MLSDGRTSHSGQQRVALVLADQEQQGSVLAARGPEAFSLPTSTTLMNLVAFLCPLCPQFPRCPTSLLSVPFLNPLPAVYHNQATETTLGILTAHRCEDLTATFLCALPSQSNPFRVRAVAAL